MLDVKFVRDHAALVKTAATKKRMTVDVDRVLELDAQRRELMVKLDNDRAEQNRLSKSIGALPADQRAKAAEEVKSLKARLKVLEDEERTLDGQLRAALLTLPSVPAPEVPEGLSDADNVEIKRVGVPRKFDFPPLDHGELLTRLGLLDQERAARISGARQYMLFGDGCLLEHGILRMALDHMIEAGFTPVQPPLMVRYEAMEGTAYFPGGEEQAYKMAKDDLFLIGTAEVPVTSIHAGEILDEAELPKRYVGMSPCFRREAGAYGRDTKGLYRIHQFWKVEQVVIDRADEEQSKLHHRAILENAERLLQKLDLPYRVVNVCGGDLGQGQVQKFDVETWMPSRGNYGETHSASRFHDFQSRRLELRYRGKDGKVRHCHTLNNTVIASPRILIPLVENHQQADGTVVLPPALRPYVAGRERLVARGK
ncbi:MAG: serine--tRNA ligase [Planctomycetes bacterium]|nr:serine--tRNA ligase [Planctomycetota bacterium]